MINQLWFLNISLELFYKLDDGVATKSMDLPRTFYTPGRKGQQNRFLSLVQGKRGLYFGLKRELFGQDKRKTRGLQRGIAGKPTKTGGGNESERVGKTVKFTQEEEAER